MADTYYAWSNIVAGDVTINVGKEVSQSDVDIEDSEWDDWVSGGVVRQQPYPSALTGRAPNDYFKDQLLKAASGDLTGDELKELQAAGVVPPSEVEDVSASDKTATAKPAATTTK
jgi:hypothetical protein